MAKVQGPEEFFEVFRTATKNPKKTEAPPGDAPAPAGETSAPSTAEAAPAPTPPAAAVPRRLPLSIFAENEPAVKVRRSTLVFAVAVAIVLLFIAYALGKRVGRASVPAAVPGALRRSDAGLDETWEPKHPLRFRKKCFVHMKVLDQTQSASSANARKFAEFLKESRDTAFIRNAGKEVHIFSYDRRLYVSVGPFERLLGGDLEALLPRLRRLRYDGVKEFDTAQVRPLPPRAKLIQ